MAYLLKRLKKIFTKKLFYIGQKTLHILEQKKISKNNFYCFIPTVKKNKILKT